MMNKVNQTSLFLTFSGRKRWHWSKEISVTSLVITKNLKWGWLLGGNCNSSGGLNNQGSNGNYWSSTENSSDNGYNANVNSSNFNPYNNNNKNNGFSLRCVR